jgi:Ca2+-transporting ATPase
VPLQILFLNLVTDVFPAFAIGMGNGDENVMTRPPRPPSEPIVTRAGWMRIAVIGALITGASLGAFVLARQDPSLTDEQAITVAFLTLALAQLWNVFNIRNPGSGLLDNDIARNPYVWWAIILCLALIGIAVWFPPLSNLMDLPPPGTDGLLLALGASALPLLVWQIWLLVRGIRSNH